MRLEEPHINEPRIPDKYQTAEQEVSYANGKTRLEEPHKNGKAVGYTNIKFDERHLPDR
jgi:hypothetical protein